MAVKAVVIGGGFSGLAGAALLAKYGFETTLVEKNKALGGRARTLMAGEYKFDMGPSWYMMPEVFERYFDSFDKKTTDYYRLKKLNPRYRVYPGNKEALTLKDDLKTNIQLFESVEKGAGKKLEEYLERLNQAYKITDRLLPMDVFKLANWLDKNNLFPALKLLKYLKPWQSWHKFSAGYFKDERLQQIVEFSSVFLGGSPYNTPALYSLLSWADFKGGVYYPMGGMGKVIEALHQLGQDQGVKYVTSAPVSGFEFEKGKIKKVMAGKKVFEADVVLSTADLNFLETKLIPKQYRTYPVKYWEKKTMGISALLLYLGINNRLKGLVHHSLYFAPNWQKNFNDIFDRGKLPKDPSFYLSARSVSDRSIVPSDGEELFVLVPLAPKFYRTEDLMELGERVIDKIEALTGEKIRPHLVYKKIYTQEDFSNDYNAYRGTALGLAHTLGQSLFMRPGIKSRKLKNLYYAGQYVNPGVGVPMAVISGQMAAGRIRDEQFNRS